MAKARRIRTKSTGVYRVGDRYEWRTRTARGMADSYDEACKAKAKADLSGPVAAAVREPFGDYARAWLAGYQGRTSRGFTEGTRAGYRESLELYAIPFFEGRKLKPHQVQRRHVKAFIAWLAATPTAAERREEIGLRRPLAARTVIKHLAPIKAMFADAVEDDDLAVNPASVRINVTSAEAPEDGDEARAFTDEQLVAVLTAASDEDRLLFDTVAATGPRWGELCEWRGKDLATGPDGPVLRVRRAFSDKARDEDGKRVELVKLPKSDRGRRDIPLEPELARRLWRLQRGPDEFLFVAPQGGRLNYHNTYSRVLTPVLEAASERLGEDVTWAAWHTFRHTVASRLFAQGRNVKQVQEWLGHHKASFTLDTYVHLMGGGIGGPLSLPVGANRGPTEAPKQAETAGIPSGENAWKSLDSARPA